MKKNSKNVVSSKRSFTLIELLVVIAIIAILASILMPALSSARERAKSAQCINNLKQSGNAIMSYVDDHKELMFYLDYVQWTMLLNRDAFVDYHNTLSQTWKSGTYMNNRNAMMCPAIAPFTWKNKNWKTTKLDGSTTDVIGRHVSTYGFVCTAGEMQRDKLMTDSEYKTWRTNFYVTKADGSQTGYSYRPQFVHNPSTFYILGDNMYKATRTAWYWAGFSIYDNIAYAVHNDKVNILWGDGHADTNGQGDLSRKMQCARKAFLGSSLEVADF